MRRRDFLGALGGAAACPLAARAQQPKMPVIGYLGSSSSDQYVDRLRAFRQGLNEIGYVEDRNVSIEFRWAEDHNDRFPSLFADLVQRRVDVIAVTGSTVATRVAKAATATIPILFSIGTDPVQLGLVASLNQPGGNLTGVTILNAELASKRLQLLHELLPAGSRFAVLVNSTNPNQAELETRNMQAASRAIGLQLQVLNATNNNEIDTAFAILAQQGPTGLVLSGDTFFFGHIEQIVALAARHSIPTIYDKREFIEAGGLISYGTGVADTQRQIGRYAGRILRGEKPADLPVMQSTKFELGINLKTAKALGLTIPLPLLGRADEVIE